MGAMWESCTSWNGQVVTRLSFRMSSDSRSSQTIRKGNQNKQGLRKIQSYRSEKRKWCRGDTPYRIRILLSMLTDFSLRWMICKKSLKMRVENKRKICCVYSMYKSNGHCPTGDIHIFQGKSDHCGGTNMVPLSNPIEKWHQHCRTLKYWMELSSHDFYSKTFQFTCRWRAIVSLSFLTW